MVPVGVAPRIRQTFAASPAEPGEFLYWFRPPARLPPAADQRDKLAPL
jgi:hypothetical protein